MVMAMAAEELWTMTVRSTPNPTKRSTETRPSPE